METTRRRLASTISCLATRSPRSMRRASSTSRSAVSSCTLPIERRYSRSESRLGSTVRSISGLRASGESFAERASGSEAVTGLPSAVTISIPWSSRYACSSVICSLVTSTSSKEAAIRSTVRIPRSWPSAISGRSSSISVIAASSASKASVLVANRSILRDETQALPRPRGRPFRAYPFATSAAGTFFLVCPEVLQGNAFVPSRLCSTGYVVCPWRNLGLFVQFGLHDYAGCHDSVFGGRPEPGSDALPEPLARGCDQRREGHPDPRQWVGAVVLGPP